jgi:hypothetical protein
MLFGLNQSLVSNLDKAEFVAMIGSNSVNPLIGTVLSTVLCNIYIVMNDEDRYLVLLRNQR